MVIFFAHGVTFFAHGSFFLHMVSLFLYMALFFSHHCISLWFHPDFSLKFVSFGLLQNFCPALSSGANLKPWGGFFHPVPCQLPDLGVQYHPWSKVWFSRQPPYPIQWVRPLKWVHLRTNPGFKKFWFIPTFLTAFLLQSTSFKERIFFSLSGIGLNFVQIGVVSCHWRLEGVRVWKLSRTYPGEKPSSLSVPTQGCYFAKCKSTQHCWQYLASQWRWEPFKRVKWPVQSQLPRDNSDIFPKKK